MTINISEAAAFGVAGNFTGHLEQAGEASDFVNVKVEDSSAFLRYLYQRKYQICRHPRGQPF